MLLLELLLLLLYVFHYVLIQGREAPPYNYEAAEAFGAKFLTQRSLGAAIRPP